MAVKKYEVEGTVYNVSEKGSEEFFRDFEGKEIISLDDDKDKDPEPKKAKGAAQGVVAGPQMPQEITPGFMPQPVETPKSTELVSENISLDSQDPKSENTYIAKSTEPKKPNKRKTNILFSNKNISYSGLD